MGAGQLDLLVYLSNSAFDARRIESETKRKLPVLRANEEKIHYCRYRAKSCVIA